MEIKTYLNRSVKNGCLLRWQTMPLKVFIAPMNFYSKQGEDLEYRQLVFKALEAWEKVGQGLIQFQLVDNLLNSQINVVWRRVDRKALGHCQFDYDSSNRLYGAEVSIGLTDGKIHKDYNSQGEVYHTILHEIGHALGLGHSPYDTDIMYSPHKYGVVDLSQNDAFSIQALYSLPASTPIKQIAAKYSIMTDYDVDMMIRKLQEKYANEDEIIESEQIPQQTYQKNQNLLDEVSNIAEIKKYNMMIQNIGISSHMQDFFNKQRRDMQ